MESAHEWYDRLYRSERPELLRLARQRLRRWGRPEDVVDDVFLRLWDMLLDGVVPESPEEWLREKVAHRARNQRRAEVTRWRRETPVGLMYDEEYDRYPPLDLDTLEFRRDFDAAVRALPEPERDAFILTELRGLSARAASGYLGTSPDTAERRAGAAHTLIRKELI